MEPWPFILLAVAAFCIARAVADLRARRLAWAPAGLVAALLLLLTPIQTHAVKLDLPAEMAPQAAGPTANPRG